MALSGIPGNVLPDVGNFWQWLRPDKIVHLFLYAVFVYLLINNTSKYLGAPKLPAKYLTALLLIGIIFGALTEILQVVAFVNRSGSFFDFLANFIGCLSGLGIYLITTKKIQRKITKQ